MADLAPLETMIEQTIDLAAAEQHEFCINPSFSPELTELHEEKTAVKDKIDRSHQNVRLLLILATSRGSHVLPADSDALLSFFVWILFTRVSLIGVVILDGRPRTTLAAT
jgi:hypothetical protein